MRTKRIYVKDAERLNLSNYPNFSKTGSIAGMKKLYYGKDAKLVICGSYIYDVTGSNGIYEAAH